jgi:hypothetical protein
MVDFRGNVWYNLDIRKENKMKNKPTVYHKADIQVPKKELDKWEDLLGLDFVDYDKEGWNDLSCVWTKTAKFEDGMEMDVKVCTVSKEDGTCWSEAVLFDPSGSEVSHTEVCDSLRGEWAVSVLDRETGENHVYVADVKEI